MGPHSPLYDPFGFLSEYDRVTLVVNGYDYPFWQAIGISDGLDQDAGTFSLTIAKGWSDIIAGVPPERLPRNLDECQVYIGSELVATADIEKMTESGSDNSHSVSFSGKSKAGRALNFACTAFKGGYFEDLSLKDAVTQIYGQYGVKPTFEEGIDVDSKIEYFHVEHGQRGHAAVEELCRMRGILVRSGADGHPVLTQAGSQRCSGALRQPGNIIDWSLERDTEQLGSHYFADGQRSNPGGTNEVDACEVSGAVIDPEIQAKGLNRPVIIPAAGEHTFESTNGRAAMEMRRRRSAANSISIKVPGWRQENDGKDGDLWQPNQLVDVKIAMAMRPVDATMLIKSRSFDMSESGQFTKLTLAPPDTFSAKPPASATQGGGGAGGGKSAILKDGGDWADVKPVLHDPKQR